MYIHLPTPNGSKGCNIDQNLYIRTRHIKNDILAIKTKWTTTSNKISSGKTLPTRYGLINLIAIQEENSTMKIII